MIRLGLRLAGRGGRGSLARLALMAGAIAVGVALVLVLVGGIVAGQRRSVRVADREDPFREGFYAGPNEGLLWSAQELRVPGSPTVTNIAVAPLSGAVPTPPGTSGVPAPGTVLVSPELRRQIDAGALESPPGRIVGTLGRGMLSRPDELVAMTGWDLAALRAADPQAQMITAFAEPEDRWTRDRLFEIGDWRSVLIGVPFALVGMSIFLLPVLVLVGAGARVGARRREQRLAALRLAGATPREMRVLTGVEGAVAGIIGSTLGLIVALLLRQVAIDEGAFFAIDLTVPILWIGLIVVMGPVFAAASAALAMGRVATKPLGPAREVPERVSPRRWWTLAVGWVVFIAGIVLTRADRFDEAVVDSIVMAGFLAIVVGLVLCGPELVQRVAGGWARHARGPAVLLAGRRLQAQPRLGFRAVLAVLLSLFVTTLLFVFLPSLDAKDTRAGATGSTLRPDLEASTEFPVGAVSLGGVALPVAGPSVAFADDVRTLPGVRGVLPVVTADARTQDGGRTPSSPLGVSSVTARVIIATCREFAAVTRTSAAGCRPGPMYAPAADISAIDLSSLTVPIVGGVGAEVTLPAPEPLDTLGATTYFPTMLIPPAFLPTAVLDAGALQGMYVDTDGTASSARGVAGLLLSNAPGFDLAPGGTSSLSIGASTTGTWLLPLLVYVFVLAACALGVVTVDGVFERRRSLAALRAAGAGPGILRRATLLEVAGPLLAVAMLGTVNGIATGIAFAILSDAPVRPAWLSLALTAGLVVGLWLAVTAVALPAVTRASSIRELRTT